MASLFRRFHRIFAATSRPFTPFLPLIRTYKRDPILGSCPSFLLPEKDNSLRMAEVDEMLQQRSPRDLVEKFKELSAVPKFRRNEHFYFAAARRLAAANHFQWIEAIIEEQKKYKTITVEVFVVRLLLIYGKSGMFEHALKLFDEMPSLACPRTVRSFNALLLACFYSKQFDRFDTFFSEVAKKLNVKPGLRSYNIKIMVFCQMGRVDSWVSVIDEMERNGITPTATTFNFVMEEYYKSGRFSDGESMWEIMESRGIRPTIWSYNSKMKGLILENRLEEALVVFDRLGTKRLMPNNSSYNVLIQGWCEVARDLEMGVEWFNKLDIAKLRPTKRTCEALMVLACELEDFDCALDVCYRAIERHYVLKEATLQGLVDGLVMEGKVGKADELVRMVRRINAYANYELTLGSDDDDD